MSISLVKLQWHVVGWVLIARTSLFWAHKKLECDTCIIQYETQYTCAIMQLLLNTQFVFKPGNAIFFYYTIKTWFRICVSTMQLLVGTTDGDTDTQRYTHSLIHPRSMHTTDSGGHFNINMHEHGCHLSTHQTDKITMKLE